MSPPSNVRRLVGLERGAVELKRRIAEAEKTAAERRAELDRVTAAREKLAAGVTEAQRNFDVDPSGDNADKILDAKRPLERADLHVTREAKRASEADGAVDRLRLEQRNARLDSTIEKLKTDPTAADREELVECETRAAACIARITTTTQEFLDLHRAAQMEAEQLGRVADIPPVTPLSTIHAAVQQGIAASVHRRGEHYSEVHRWVQPRFFQHPASPAAAAKRATHPYVEEMIARGTEEEPSVA